MTEIVANCRICLQEIVNIEQYYFLNNDNVFKLKYKLLDVLPEIDLNITSNPIICKQCMITIEEIFAFKQLCIQTETTITNLRQIPCDNVLTYVKKETVKAELIDNNIKIDPTDVQIIKEDCCEINRDVSLESSKTELYHCHNCDFKTNGKANMIQHLKIHKIIRPFQCDMCNFSTGCIHNKEIIYNQYKFACVDKTILASRDLGEKRFKSDIYNYSSNGNANLLQKHTGGKLLKCNTCDYCSNHRSTLKRHMRKHTGEKPFKCNKCDYCSSDKANLKVHIRKHANEKPFKCTICNYTSITNSVFKIHMRKHTGEKPFKCNICDYCTYYKKGLKLHIHKHIGEKPFKCNICDYCSSDKRNLEKHMYKHTVEKSFNCNICDYRTNQLASLNVHIRKHTGEQPFKCDICGYCCSYLGHLKTHMRRHTGDKPFKCNVCDYCSITKSDLKVHMRKHTGEKPYKCNVCGYCCSDKGNLRTHIMYKHSSEKPFKCNICDYCSKRSGNLKRHIRLHTCKKI